VSHYKPYLGFKNTGIEWLEQVPEHWGVTRLGFVAWVRARLGWKGLKAEEYVDAGFVLLATPNIKGSDIDFENVNFINETRYEESPEIKIRVGDVLLAKDGSTLGTVNIVRSLPNPATVNSSIAVITPNAALNSAYLFYQFKSSYIENTIQILKGGMGVPHLFQADLNKFPVPVPPLHEQLEIVTHLDRETTRIDALVSKKTRFIELLREKRQALITHAVTNGLDPNVKMKDSGVEWLGEVPAHWSVCKLSLRYSVELGKMLDEKRITGECLVPYLRNQDVQWDAINIDGLPEMDIGIGEIDRYTVRRGDLLVCEGGDVGRAAIWKGSNQTIGFQKALHRLRARSTKRDTAEFLYFSLLSAKECGVFEESDAKATIAHLPAEKFRQYRFAFPPLPEQLNISAYVQGNGSRIDTLISKTERSIELLKERRSALITAAVTGQIDLRKAA
jgi:type I restriction enzyme S subunit